MELIIYSIQVLHVLVSILLIVVVLLQPGKGGDLGSVFGGGGGGGTSESIFGASGAVPFLSKVTRVLAVLFLVSSLTLGYFATQKVGSSVVTDVPASQQTSDFDQPVEAQQPQAVEDQAAAPVEASEDTPPAAPAQGEGATPDTSGSMSAEPESSEGSEAPPASDEGTQ